MTCGGKKGRGPFNPPLLLNGLVHLVRGSLDSVKHIEELVVRSIKI